ncbi:hypothetical protein BH09DEP1_BH09DEP1_3930 [soil metagenome]
MKKNTFTKIILTFALLSYSPTLFPMAKDSGRGFGFKVAPVTNFLNQVAKNYVRYYAVSTATTAAHEFGHLLTAKVLMGLEGSVHFWPTLAGMGGYTVFKLEDTGQMKGINAALMFAAGPIFGMAAGYSILKVLNMCNAYKESKKIKDAIETGFKEPAFSQKQDLNMKILVGYSMLVNLINFVPFEVEAYNQKARTDGAWVIHALT